MSKPKKPEPADVDAAIMQDEYAGKGGSYIFDPLTGKRTPTPNIETPTKEG